MRTRVTKIDTTTHEIYDPAERRVWEVLHDGDAAYARAYQVANQTQREIWVRRRRVIETIRTSVIATPRVPPMPKWKQEFPDFNDGDIPPIPEGFEDVSWHNDSCPSFLNEAAGLIIFCEHPNPDMREHPESPRFGLVVWDNGTTDERACDTNRWDTILAAIQARSAK